MTHNAIRNLASCAVGGAAVVASLLLGSQVALAAATVFSFDASGFELTFSGSGGTLTQFNGAYDGDTIGGAMSGKYTGAATGVGSGEYTLTSFLFSFSDPTKNGYEMFVSGANIPYISPFTYETSSLPYQTTGDFLYFDKGGHSRGDDGRGDDGPSGKSGVEWFDATATYQTVSSTPPLAAPEINGAVLPRAAALLAGMLLIVFRLRRGAQSDKRVG
jgi:hypothetical protein